VLQIAADRADQTDGVERGALGNSGCDADFAASDVAD
jgi:hypothetical protein